MTELIVHIVGLILLLGGGVVFVVAIVFTAISILLFMLIQDRYWEEKASFFGLLALCHLPIGGIGGGLLLALHLFYDKPPALRDFYVLVGTGVFAFLAVGFSIFLLLKSPTRLD